jgi:transposase
MSAVVGQAPPAVSTSETPAKPYEQISVTLTKQEHVELILQAHNWRSRHQRAVARIEQQRQQYDQALERIKALEKLVQAHERVRLREAGLREQLVYSLEQARLREATLRKQHVHDLEQAQQQQAALREQLAQEQAYSRELRHRLFGQRTEKSRALNKASAPSQKQKRPRGQQPGRPGHGRTRLTQLPVVEETAEINAAVCPRCGLALQAFPGSDDCDVVEFEVRAWRRVIHRQRYHPVCQCGCLPGIVAAPAPPRLIPRGKLGVSVWVHLLLGKYLHGQPLHRLLQDWEDQGLHLSAGTVTDGLHRLAPMFEPLQQALLDHLRGHTHWHADETRWEVFVEHEGKRGHRWYLWVFHSPTVAYYTLDPSHSSKVPKQVLAGCEEGILSVDRHSAYKGYVNKHPGVRLSFCWAHQRRDFLRVANDHPHLESWAMNWVDRIGELYKLHARRQEAGLASAEFNVRDQQLRQAVQSMCLSCEQSLAEGRLAAPAIKALRSLQRHWQGLILFVEQPWLPLDNNAAERALRPAVVGRKNFYGSGSQWSGEVGATLMSLLMTVKLWKINARAWLSAYLNACANEGGRAPSDLSAFIPWQMSEAQLAAMRAGPGKASHHIDSS